MLSHVLRMNHDALAQLALYCAFIGAQAYKPRLGRHWTNLVGTISAYLKQAGPRPLRKARQLHCLRQCAHDKAEDQLEGLIAAAGCHSYYRDCGTQSIIYLGAFHPEIKAGKYPPH